MIYMDNAPTSYPKPAKVIEATAECMAGWCANPGRAGHKYAMRSAEAVYNTRKKAARIVSANAEAENIIFTKNCTEALNIAIKGILNNGEHVITTMMEHNSVLRPLFAAKRRGIETSLLKCDNEGSVEIKSIEKKYKTSIEEKDKKIQDFLLKLKNNNVENKNYNNSLDEEKGEKLIAINFISVDLNLLNIK